jgi:hypothetical protein
MNTGAGTLHLVSCGRVDETGAAYTYELWALSEFSLSLGYLKSSNEVGDCDRYWSLWKYSHVLWTLRSCWTMGDPTRHCLFCSPTQVWLNAPVFLFFFCFFFLFVERGFELRALHLQSNHSPTWAMTPIHFALIILELGYRELFALAGLEPQSFQPLS